MCDMPDADRPACIIPEKKDIMESHKDNDLEKMPPSRNFFGLDIDVTLKLFIV